jgi:glucose-1-phosphate thymidylyltransferase
MNSSSGGGDTSLHLLPVANRAVVLRVLDDFARAGIREVTVAVDPRLNPRTRDLLKSDRKWPFALSYLTAPARSGVLGAVIGAGKFRRDRPLLLHWACGLFKTPLDSLLGDTKVGPLDTVLLVDRPQAESAVVELASQRLAAVTDQSRTGRSGGLAGVALLGSAAPDVARSLPAGRGGDLDVLALVERMVQLGGRARTLPAGVCWRYTGAGDSALELNRFLLSGLGEEPVDVGSPDTIVQGPVRVDSSAMLERATIRGPVVIGPRACLIDAWIGPYTSIGEDVHVEGAEIENSIVLGATRISHLDSRLEASVVGPHATVCRDFRLPRALRLCVGDGATVSLT